MSKRKGVLTVISGYSGSGKGTVMNALMKKYGEEMLKNLVDTYKSILGWLLPVSLLVVLALGAISFIISSKLYERRAR